MPVVRLRERGQLTIPFRYRRDLGLEEKDALNIEKIGDVLVLAPKRLAGEKTTRKFEEEMKKRGLALRELLGELKRQRSRYGKAFHGKAET